MFSLGMFIVVQWVMVNRLVLTEFTIGQFHVHFTVGDIAPHFGVMSTVATNIDLCVMPVHGSGSVKERAR